MMDAKTNEIISTYMEGMDPNNVNKSDLVQSIIAQVGKGTSEQGMDMGNTPHKARITIDFTEFQYGGSLSTTGYILKKLQSELRGILPADVQLSIKKNEMGPPQEAPINIELTNISKGEYKELILIATEVKKYLDRQAVEGRSEERRVGKECRS